MKVYNATIGELECALAQANANGYQGNLDFQHIIPTRKGADFRLTVKSSKGPGARRGAS